MAKHTDLKRQFVEVYGPGAEPRLYFCPGRVNLIGEHIDYNGGMVFPTAIARGISCAVRRRSDRMVVLRSLQKPSVVTIDLSVVPTFVPADDWANYPKGVIKLLLEQGVPVVGADILFDSDLPMGSGVSSSAAMEVLTGYVFLHESLGEDIDRVKLALLCQRAEREFIGVQCGIMDQFSVALAQRGKAILLDCATLNHRYVPFHSTTHSLVVMNTNKPRELAGSKYNERRGECERALTILRQGRELENLCEATETEVTARLSGDDLLLRRARHVVTENQRVHRAVDALEKNDWATFGRLMTESHMSLRFDYEVTGKELDTIVDRALIQPGCLGARMTGAGFGGCAIALVADDRLAAFQAAVGEDYTEFTGLKADFILSKSEDGVRLVA